MNKLIDFLIFIVTALFMLILDAQRIFNLRSVSLVVNGTLILLVLLCLIRYYTGQKYPSYDKPRFGPRRYFLGWSINLHNSWTIILLGLLVVTIVIGIVF